MAYKETDPTTFSKKTEESRQRRTGSSEFWKPQVGKTGSPVKNVIRILPRHENMEDVFVQTKIHFNLGPNKDQWVPCLKFWEKPCAACDHVDGLYKRAKAETGPEAAKALKDQAGSQKAKDQFYCQIVDMNHPEKGVQVYSCGPDNEKKIRLSFYDDDGEFRDVTNVKTGRDIIMHVDKKPGTDFNQYEIKAKEKPSPVKDPEWLEKIEDLNPLIKEPTPAEVAAALRGIKTAKTSTTAAKEEEQKTAGKTETASAARQPAEQPKPTRQPVPAPEPAKAEVSWDAARAAIVSLGKGFNSPIPIEPEEVDGIPKPECYTKETEPDNPACQGCRLLIPCMAAKLAAEAAA